MHAMVDVLSQANTGQAEKQNYHHLRVFSGITPTLAGEEFMEYWLEQATKWFRKVSDLKKKRGGESWRV